MFTDLSTRDQEIVLLAAKGLTQGKIGEKVGLTRVRVCQILNSPKQQAALKETRLAMAVQSVDRLRHGSSEAVATLIRCLRDPESTWGAKLKAADLVLKYAGIDPRELREFAQDTEQTAVDDVIGLLAKAKMAREQQEAVVQ